MSSITDIVLETARAEFGAKPFDLQSLAVRCWRRHGGLFGLKGYERLYPDFGVVRNVVYGKRGLFALNKLERLPDGKARLAPEPAPTPAPEPEPEPEPEDARRVKGWSEMMGEV